jgi:hypothetical protein
MLEEVNLTVFDLSRDDTTQILEGLLTHPHIYTIRIVVDNTFHLQVVDVTPTLVMLSRLQSLKDLTVTLPWLARSGPVFVFEPKSSTKLTQVTSLTVSSYFKDAESQAAFLASFPFLYRLRFYLWHGKGDHVLSPFMLQPLANSLHELDISIVDMSGKNDMGIVKAYTEVLSLSMPKLRLLRFTAPTVHPSWVASLDLTRYPQLETLNIFGECQPSDLLRAVSQFVRHGNWIALRTFILQTYSVNIYGVQENEISGEEYFRDPKRVPELQVVAVQCAEAGLQLIFL